MNTLKVTAHGSTLETIALSQMLVGFDLRVDGKALRDRLRAMLDQAEVDTVYSGERFDREAELALWLADRLREKQALNEASARALKSAG